MNLSGLFSVRGEIIVRESDLCFTVFTKP